MARLSPTRPRGLLARLATVYGRRTYGQDLTPGGLAAHSPVVMRSTVLKEIATLTGRWQLPQDLRDLVTHRVAVVIGCPWCIDFGAMLALKAGLTPERILAVPDFETSDLFTPLEKRALRYADALTATPLTVTDEQVEELRRELGERGVVELTEMVALENHRSRFNHGLGITAQGFTAAEVCALPPR